MVNLVILLVDSHFQFELMLQSGVVSISTQHFAVNLVSLLVDFHY